jgi:hypothetical protein
MFVQLARSVMPTTALAISNAQRTYQRSRRRRLGAGKNYDNLAKIVSGGIGYTAECESIQTAIPHAWRKLIAPKRSRLIKQRRGSDGREKVESMVNYPSSEKKNRSTEITYAHRKLPRTPFLQRCLKTGQSFCSSPNE